MRCALDELRAHFRMKPMRRCVQNRWWREGRGSAYREYGRRVRQSVPRRAEQVPGATRLDATPQRDTGVPSCAGLTRACAVASPQAGRVGGRKRGPAGDLTPQTRMGSASHRRACDRRHGRIPQAGPCSTLRRSLLHAPARRRFWTQPAGLARVLAQGFVARLGNIRDITCVALRAPKQNRASAARVSF